MPVRKGTVRKPEKPRRKMGSVMEPFTPEKRERVIHNSLGLLDEAELRLVRGGITALTTLHAREAIPRLREMLKVTTDQEKKELIKLAILNLERGTTYRPTH